MQEARHAGDFRSGIHAALHTAAHQHGERRRQIVFGDDRAMFASVECARLFVKPEQSHGEQQVFLNGIFGIDHAKILAVALAPEARVTEIDEHAFGVLRVQPRIECGDLRERGRILKRKTRAAFHRLARVWVPRERFANVAPVARAAHLIALGALVALVHQQQVGAAIVIDRLLHTAALAPRRAVGKIKLGNLGHADRQPRKAGGFQFRAMLCRQRFIGRDEQDIFGLERLVLKKLQQIQMQH